MPGAGPQPGMPAAGAPWTTSGYGGPPPGFPPPPPGGGSGRPGWVVPLVVVVAVLLVGGLVTGGIVFAARLGGAPQHGSAPRGAASGGASGSASASPSAAATYAKLPDGCAIGAALPKRAKGVRADGSNSSDQQRLCQWESLTTARGVALNVTLTLASDVATARGSYRNDLDYAGDESANGGDEGNVRRLPKLGDEAFAAAVAGPIISGKTEADAITYPLTGAKVVARDRNVLVVVEYRAAVYDEPRTGNTLHGHGMTYDESRSAATAVARHYLSLLA